MGKLMICEECNNCTVSNSTQQCFNECYYPVKALDEFKEMKHKQEQGLLIELPVAEGTQVEEIKSHTNAERIRSMSDEELASFLANFEQQDIGNEWCLKLCPEREAKRASGVDCDCQYENYETALAWLKSEVKE